MRHKPRIGAVGGWVRWVALMAWVAAWFALYLVSSWVTGIAERRLGVREGMREWEVKGYSTHAYSPWPDL